MMDAKQFLYVVYVVALILYLITIGILWRFFNPVQKRALLVLNAITFPVYLLYFVNIFSSKTGNPFWFWFLDVNDEFGLMATYSSTILMVTGLAACGILLFGRFNLWMRGFWALSAFVFVFLAFDEYYLIHEGIQATFGYWQRIYVVSAVLIVLASSLCWIRSKQGTWTLLLLYLLGLGVIGASGIALDFIFQEIACRNPTLGPICADLNLVEEILETLGTCFVLAIFLRVAAEQFPVIQRRYRSGLIVGALVWLLMTAGYQWIIPSIEVQFAQRVEVQFDEGRVSLISYRLGSQQIQPDRSVQVTVYLRANQPVDRLYQVSAHVMTQEYASIAQDDPLAALFPSYAWLPGVTIRQNLSLPVGSELPAPQGYVLALSVWDFNQPDQKPVPSGNLPVLYDSTVELARLTAFANQPLPAAPDSAVFEFAGGVRLNGYSYPAQVTAGENATFSFWWQAGSSPLPAQTHFLHLLSSQSAEQHLVFTQVPLAGSLPTSNWIAGLTFVDDWQVTIPPDAVPGSYEVVSGLFNQSSGERLTVSGINGAPTRDLSMILGQIEVQQR